MSDTLLGMRHQWITTWRTSRGFAIGVVQSRLTGSAAAPVEGIGFAIPINVVSIGEKMEHGAVKPHVKVAVGVQVGDVADDVGHSIA